MHPKTLYIPKKKKKCIGTKDIFLKTSIPTLKFCIKNIKKLLAELHFPIIDTTS